VDLRWLRRLSGPTYGVVGPVDGDLCRRCPPRVGGRGRCCGAGGVLGCRAVLAAAAGRFGCLVGVWRAGCCDRVPVGWRCPCRAGSVTEPQPV